MEMIHKNKQTADRVGKNGWSSCTFFFIWLVDIVEEVLHASSKVKQNKKNPYCYWYSI